MRKIILITATALIAIIICGCDDGGYDGSSAELDTYLSQYLGTYVPPTDPPVDPTNPADTAGPPVNPDANYTLTIIIHPDAVGTVVRNPSQNSYKSGTTVTVTASPKTGYEFIGWGGIDQTSNAATITMDGNLTLTAVLKPITPPAVIEPIVDTGMVLVKGGTFTMGCVPESENACADNESPAHSVTLDNYYIGKFEVTQRLYKSVMGKNPSVFNGDSLPVEFVSWNDAQTFIVLLNNRTGNKYRLPTEAEWEYAARGGANGATTKYSGGNNINDVAWYSANSAGTNKVGFKTPNALKIYDMSGNVWEWVSDWYWKYNSAPQTNPKGPKFGVTRVLRGGSFESTDTDCRVYKRNDTGGPDTKHRSIGFRLAKSI